MERTTKQLWILFGLLILVKLLLVSFVHSPSIFSDEYFYAKMGQSVSESGSWEVHGEKSNAYPPLYSLILSMAYLFNNMGAVYFFMKAINVLTSSAIIFPVFLLGKEVMNKQRAIMAATIVGIMPMNFALAPYLLSENVFYTLFLLTIYFMYKAIMERKTSWHIATGIVMGLAILTRVIGLVLIPLYLISVVINDRREKKGIINQELIKKGSIVYGTCAIVILPWIIRNSKLFGANLQAIMGSSYVKEVLMGGKSSTNIVLAFILWTIIYGGMMILASGVLFPSLMVSALKRKKEKKIRVFAIIAWSAIGLILLGAVNHSAKAVVKGIITWLPGRPIGRYSDIVLPLIVILGCIGLFESKQNDRTVKKSLYLIIPILAIASLSSLFKLFLANHVSLSWLGTIKYGLERMIYGKQSFEAVFFPGSFILIFLLLVCIPLLILWVNKQYGLNNKKVLGVLMIFFAMTSLVSYGISIKNATKWHESEQSELGRWIATNIPSEKEIVFDKQDCKSPDLLEEGVLCNTKADTTIAGFWIRNKIRIAESTSVKKDEVLVSTQEYPFKELKKFKQFTVYLKE